MDVDMVGVIQLMGEYRGNGRTEDRDVDMVGVIQLMGEYRGHGRRWDQRAEGRILRIRR
jgi:hypothetical protein